jgi:hypothetical protein
MRARRLKMRDWFGIPEAMIMALRMRRAALPAIRSGFDSSEFQRHLVHVAPTPVLPRLERANHRMPGLVKVFGGVPVRR